MVAVAMTTAAMIAVSPVAPAAASSSDTYPRGVDISKWQRPGGAAINWTAVTDSGRSFAFIRSTYGGSVVDPYFASSWASARRAGVYRGAYHYALPSSKPGSAVTQARFFVKHAGRHQGVGDLPPVLDVESSGGLSQRHLSAWVKTWLQTVSSLTGRRPVVYTGGYFWGHALGTSSDFSAYPLWLAQWSTRAAPHRIAGMQTWSFWQHSDTGRVPGFARGVIVDLDRFNGTAADLRRVAHPASSLSLVTSAPTVTTGSTLRLSGSLRSRDGKAIANAPLHLYRRVAGSTMWASAGTAASTRAGAFRFVQRPTTSTAYKVSYPGGVNFAASGSSARTVAVSKFAKYERITLRVGSRGATVRVLQRALHVSADGVFGPQTKAAVVALQFRAHLPQTGVVNTATWRALG